jgi:hypothetical protein
LETVTSNLTDRLTDQALKEKMYFLNTGDIFTNKKGKAKKKNYF